MNQRPAASREQNVLRPARAGGYPSWLPTAGLAGLTLLALSRRRTIATVAVAGGAYFLYRRGAFDDALRSLPQPAWPDAGQLADTLTERAMSLWPNETTDSSATRREFVPPAGTDAVTEASMESFPASDPPATY